MSILQKLWVLKYSWGPLKKVVRLFLKKIIVVVNLFKKVYITKLTFICKYIYC